MTHPARTTTPPWPVRVAEAVAAGMGTARFLAAQTFVILAWIGYNTVTTSGRFDPYPYILLTLALSLQAAYAAPLILLAQSRQSTEDRAQAAHDYTTDQEALRLLRVIHADTHGQDCHCWEAQPWT